MNVSELQRIALGPSDVLVVNVPRGMDQKRLMYLHEQLQGVFRGHKVLIVEEGISFSAIGVKDIAKWEDPG